MYLLHANYVQWSSIYHSLCQWILTIKLKLKRNPSETMKNVIDVYIFLMIHSYCEHCYRRKYFAYLYQNFNGEPNRYRTIWNTFSGDGNYPITENYHLHSTWLSNAVVFANSSNSGFTVLCTLGWVAEFSSLLCS